MATSKQSFARAAEPQCSVSAQREEEMHVKAPLTTMYVHNGSAPGLQPYPQAQPRALQDATVVPVFLPRMCSNQPLPALTFHIASSTPLQQQRLSAPATSSRPKSTGKHVCPHCGKDCLKPSVLEKHLRCHTGERPYPCTTCGISFKTQSNLYKHKRTQAHARLSNESDKGTFSSQESTDISKDNRGSSSIEIHFEESADIKQSDEVFPTVSVTTECPSEGKTKSETGWPLHKAAVDGLSTTLQEKVHSLCATVQLSPDVKDNYACKNTNASSENGRGPLTPNRTPLQRQEALFSKPWESPTSRGKSQSHDSTDSGFSDICEHHLSSSPGSSLHDPSIESMPETTIEHQELDASQASSKMTPDDPKSKVSIQEKQKLEERISKLIYENSVLVEDKQLENVRPRKTVLSKQGSIDLPVPYTYKDSFHFEIRSSKHITSSQKQDKGGGAIYRSVPTQHSTSLEHAPLTRSSSLPFTVGGKHTDGAIITNLSRRCSAGHVYPSISTDQQAPCHRSLVRQAAVDCQPTSDGSSVDRTSISSLSSDGDSTDIATESSMKGNYRKKTRKFDYTKWHTYKGGTFRKLYNTDRDCSLKTKKTPPSIEPTEGIQISQPGDNASVSLNFTSCSVVCLSQTANMSLAQTPNQATSSYILLNSSPLEKKGESTQILTLQNDPKCSFTNFETINVNSTVAEREKLRIQSTDFHIPSERKKQRTGDDVHMLSMSHPRMGQVNANLHGLIGQPRLPNCAIAVPAQNVNVPNLHQQSSFTYQFSNPSQLLCKTPNPFFCLINMSGTSGNPSVSTSSLALPETKTSFPPKYQLKIPSPTDGVSGSSSTLEHNTSPNLSALGQSQCHPVNSLLSSKQCQAASKVTPFVESKQGTVCETSSVPVLSLSSSGQNHTNTLSKVLTQIQPTTPTFSFVSPTALPTVQHQISLLQSNCTRDVVENQSTGPVSSSHPQKTSDDIQSFKLLNTVSTVSGSADTTVKIDSSAKISPTVQNQPVFTFEKPPGFTEYTQSSVFESTLNSTVSKMATGDFQGSQSDAKVIQSHAQNTFYVRTADLQIVMQLISDEQLALIEPHIEKTDIRPAQSSVTSSICANQISLLQDAYKDNGTNVCVTQNMVNNDKMGQKSETIILKPCGFENACGLNFQNVKYSAEANTSLPCVSSWSHSQTQHISASVDNRTDPAGQFYDSHKISKNFQDSESVGFNFSTESSHHKQVAGDKPSELDLMDKTFLIKQDGKECYSVHSLDKINSSGPKVAFIQDQTSTDRKQELNIETTDCLKESNHTPIIKSTEPVEPNKTRQLMPVTLLRDAEGVQTVKTTQFGFYLADKTIPITTPMETPRMEKALISTIQPCQSKSCWAACSDAREMKECDTGKLKLGAQGNEASTQYEIQQSFGNYIDNFKAYSVVPNRTSNCIPGDSFKCEDVHVNLDTFTGHGEDGALKSLWFERDPGTENKESLHKESEDADEEKSDTKMADKNNTCQSCGNNDKQDKREEESSQTAAQAHRQISQEVINVSLNISNPTQHDKFNVPNNPAPSVCNIPSQTCQPQGQEGCYNYTRRDSEDGVFGKGTSPETSQRETASPGYALVSPSPGLGVAGFANQTCRHPLECPILVNANQKETLTRNVMTHWTCAKGTEVQVISPQNKLNSMTVSGSVLQHHCSASTTEAVNTSTTSSSCAGLMHSNPPHKTYNQITSNSQTDSKLFNSASNSYLEHEDSNSSSDDEQKLVIELE
ncbi:zinc finger protein 831 [Triplophysa rosa]|uniref:Zinc finger protein 831 n=1 Tax=Triplophysa rosa TaxID=992332 RepID=A0A9W7WCV5_TRIRA|nr:zinc finger protein 831 [Triplophysa rosa]KAI7795346.1 putative zinc finger protein 831 [Triplophysa rosa]